jgi:branched-subunit amino acid transport protein
MASAMNLWAVFLLVGLLTYAIRLSFVFLQGRVEMPSWFPRALRFVPIAVLSALIAPELFRPGGTLDVSLGNARLLAGLLAIGVAWRTRRVGVTIGVGMAALLALQFVLGR